MLKSSLALRNLRGIVILLILAFHSFVAYVAAQPAAPFPFDQAPYAWRGYPIVDSDRWIGFDLFCAFQFLYLMQLMFFYVGAFCLVEPVARGLVVIFDAPHLAAGGTLRRRGLSVDASCVFSRVPGYGRRSELVGVSVPLGGSANHTCRSAMVPVVPDGTRYCHRCALRAVFAKTRFIDFPFSPASCHTR